MSWWRNYRNSRNRSFKPFEPNHKVDNLYFPNDKKSTSGRGQGEPMFVGDEIAAYEFNNLMRSRARTPEQMLALAVLEDALSIVFKIRRVEVKYRLPAREAIDWFNSYSKSYVYDFETICSLFNLDAAAIRERVNLLLSSTHIPRWKVNRRNMLSNLKKVRKEGNDEADVELKRSERD